MPHLSRGTRPKANSISLFFLLFLLGSVCVAAVPHRLSADLSVPIIQIVGLPNEVTMKAPAYVPKVVQHRAEARLKIPKIGVNAVIKEVGVTPTGVMAVPSNRIDVGWFSLGTIPGETGSAVIGAHNEFASAPGVFANLDQLQRGDSVSVVDAKGASISFVVRDIQTYDATDIHTGIFESDSGVHLNLVTCTGEWDPITKSSAKRLVIFTDAVQPSREVAIAPIRTP